MRNAGGGVGVRWTPLPAAEAPPEPTGENVPNVDFGINIRDLRNAGGGVPYDWFRLRFK